MKKVYFLLLLSLCYKLVIAQTTGSFQTTVTFNSSSHTLAYYVPTNYNSSNSYPLIVALHGCGVSAVTHRNSFVSWANTLNAILVCPDNSGGQMAGATGGLINKAIDDATGGYNIDTTAVYLTGFSCNGQETMKQGWSNIYPFRGLIPLNPWLPNLTGYNYASADIPTCICSGTLDNSFSNSQTVYNNLITNNKQALFNPMPGINHMYSFTTRDAELSLCKDWIDNLYLFKNPPPCNPPSIYPFVYNGKQYEVVRDAKTWPEASLCAAGRGGYLAEINSQAEQDSIYDAIVNGAGISSVYTVVNDGGGVAYVWIGGHDMGTEGRWVWNGNNDSSETNFWNGEGANGLNNGSLVAGHFENWGRNANAIVQEPDNFTNQDGVAIGLAGWPSSTPLYGNAGEWNDIKMSNSLYYVIEYDCGPNSDSILLSSCDSIASPSGKHIWHTSGVYMDTLMNAGGCDSILKVNVDITPLDTTVSQVGSILTSNDLKAGYQWVDCNLGVALAGEINRVYSPSTNGSYSVEINRNGCVDTSKCFVIDNIRLFENEVSEFMVYPSPTKGLIEIRAGKAVQYPLNVKVRNGVGQLVSQYTFNDGASMFIELEGAKGLYFIEIYHRQILLNQLKVVKN